MIADKERKQNTLKSLSFFFVFSFWNLTKIVSHCAVPENHLFARFSPILAISSIKQAFNILWLDALEWWWLLLNISSLITNHLVINPEWHSEQVIMSSFIPSNCYCFRLTTLKRKFPLFRWLTIEFLSQLLETAASVHHNDNQCDISIIT